VHLPADIRRPRAGDREGRERDERRGKWDQEDLTCQNLRLRWLASGVAPTITYGEPPVFLANQTRGPYREDPICATTINRVTWTIWAGLDGGDTVTASRVCSTLTGEP
jgi:hypothetical protein